jgi:predicted transcriptional regulator
MSLSEESFAVLNVVYLRKLIGLDAVVDITGLPASRVRAALDELVEAGAVADLGETFMLEQPDGASAAIAEYDERYAHLRTSPEAVAWYERFEVLNAQFLKAISAWQTTGEEEAALDKVLRLVDRQMKALESFAEHLPRYRRYAARFLAAIDQVEQGRTEFVTSLSVDSVHNVWFELHEDILTVLGRPRDVAEAESG